MGSGLARIAEHDAWALWLAAPVVGIVLVCLAVWWWSRPARPATTSRSIAGHHAYLDALARSPHERVTAPPVDPPPAPVVVADAGAPSLVLDATDDPSLDAAVVTVRT